MARYLDEPFLGVVLDLERAQSLLRDILRPPSPLPDRLCRQLARCQVTLTRIRRDVQRHSAALQVERAQKEPPPSGM